MSNSIATTTGRQVTLEEIRMDTKAFPRLISYQHEVAVAEMSKIVTQALLYKGQAIDPVHVASTASALVDELMADEYGIGTRYITFAEISRAVKKAILTTEVYGISVVTIYKILSEYIKGEGHMADKAVSEAREKRRRQEVKDSIVAPMLTAYAGKLIMNHETKQ